MTNQEIAQKAVKALRDAINSADRKGVVAAIEMVESDDFNWDEVEVDLYDSWAELLDQINF